MLAFMWMPPLRRVEHPARRPHAPRPFPLARLVLAVMLLGGLAGCQLATQSALRAPTLRARQQAWQDENLPWTFQHMAELFPTRTVSRAGEVQVLPSEPADLGSLHFEFGRERLDLEAFLARSHTRGLVVLSAGRRVFEYYAPGADETTRFTSWSVAKSLTASLVGIALGEGKIESLQDRLDRYLPELKGSAYEGVRIEQALQMSSGVKFDEVYEDDGSDVFDFLVSSMMTQRERADELAMRFPREAAPGTRFNYNTAETQVLGWLVRRVTGRTASDYLEEKIWRPLGMEHDASWVIDREGPDGVEMAGCCLNMALRDWARFGQLMARGGVHGSRRILPEGWVAAATQPRAPHLAFGRVDPPADWGYGYQWWALPGGRFSALGVFGQYIYVDPGNAIVIAMASSWPVAWDSDLDRLAVTGFAAIVSQLTSERSALAARKSPDPAFARAPESP